MIELYQLTISHYCEKARWALDYKGLPWRRRNLLPGLHVAKARKLTGQTSLPILVDDGQAIHESHRILDHLDQRYAARSLTPADPDLAQEACEWERFADEEIGDHVRRICYHTLLEDPDVVIALLTKGGPWYGRMLLRRTFPELRRRMRKYMNITPEATEDSRAKLDAAVRKLETTRHGRSHLVGDAFTRADLAVCALLAPLVMPPQYGVDWPARPPAALADEAAHQESALAWVRATYAAHRP